MSSVFIDNSVGGVSVFPDAPGGSQIGPFKIGANLYVLAQGDASFSSDTAVYKSIDNGVTWTGPLDSAHAFTISNFQGWWSGFVIGTVLYFCFFNQNVNPQITLQKFDTTTDLYIGGTIAHNIGFPTNNTAVSTYHEVTGRPSAAVVRSNGDIVIPMIQMENVAATFYYRTRFSVYNGAWGTVDVLCGQNGSAVHDIVCGTILGSSDRTHVFYVEYGTKTLQHRTITSANAVQTAQTVANDIFDPGGVNNQSLIESIGSPAFNSTTGEIAIPYKDINGNLKMARAISADTPTWTTEQVQNTIVVLKHGQANGSQVSSAYYDISTGNLSVLFLDNQIAPAIVNIYRVIKSGGVWGAPVLLTATGIPSGGGTIIQSIHASASPFTSAIFYTPDGSGLNYILSFQAFGSPPPSIGPNRYGVKTFLQPQPANSIPYRLCVNNNRLYCVLPDNTGIFSCFVYYLGRENNQGGYWYRYAIDPAALFSEEDGTLFGGFGDAGIGDIYVLDAANTLQFAGTNINMCLIFPFSKNDINQRKDVYHLRFHVDTGNSALTLTGYTEFGPQFALGTIQANGLTEINLLIQNTNFNLAKRMALAINGACAYFKLIDWSIDYDARPEPLSYLRIATNYGLASKKRLRTIPIVIDTRGQAVNINVSFDGVAYGNQSFTTSERTTVFYYMNTDVFATDIIINVTATSGNVFEFYDAPAPVNVETLPVGKLFDQIGPIEFERNGELFEFRVRMLATTNTITYNVYMDDSLVVSAQPLTVTPNVDMTYGPIKLPKGIRGSVCRIEFLSSAGVFYRWNCKLKYYTGGVKSDLRQVTIQDASMGLQR